MTFGPRARSRFATATLVLGCAYQVVILVSVLTYQRGRVNVLDSLHPISIRRDTYGEDLYCNFQAGRSFLDGKNMYLIEGANVVVPKVVPYGYPPPMGIAFTVPNLLFTAEQMHVVWIFTIVAMLVGSGFVLGWHLGLSWTDRKLLLSMFLLFSPLYPEYFLGQYNVMLVAFLVATLVLDERGRGAWSAAAWGLSIVLKPSFIALAPLYLRHRRVLRLAAVAAFVLVATVPYYRHYSGSLAQSSGIYTHGMVRNAAEAMGFYAFVLDALLRLGVPLFGALHTARNTALVMAACAVLLLFLDREAPADRWTAYLVITYALGQHLFWEQSYIVLLPVLALMGFRHGDRRAFLVWALLALPSLFAPLRAMNIDFVRPYGAANKGFVAPVLAMGMLHHGLKAMPLFVYWLLLLWERRNHLGLPWRR